MQLSDLKGAIPNEIVESLRSRGINEFTPPQAESLRVGVASGASVVVASPTASGKTLVAEIACVSTILSRGRKAIYVAPMRALVNEKFSEFKDAYPYLKAAISTGDFDSSDQWLADYELIFVSTEKLDSLMRHKMEWINSVGCIVFDEVHLLGDQHRGPTLELLMTKLKELRGIQIVALSATIGNADEIADWLGARLVTSDYRPVKLLKGAVASGKIYYVDGDRLAEGTMNLRGAADTNEERVLEDTLLMGKQALVFYSTKRNAEAGSQRLSKISGRFISEDEKKSLAKTGNAVLNVLDKPTQQCVKLSEVLSHGAAFHHSGLLPAQRNYIESAFKSGQIKVVCSTTTLGFGVNMPAHTVLIRDISRHNGYTSERIGVNEVLQLLGRAGRPKYDTEGRALISAGSEGMAADLVNEYLIAEPEPIYSNLGILPILRMHILSFIAEGFLDSMQGINEFLSKTFYSHQYGSDSRMRAIVREVLGNLLEWDFIEDIGGQLRATRIGKRISELYIDPLSAKWMVDTLQSNLDETGALYLVCNTVEMRPYVKITEDAELQFVAYRKMNYGSAIYETEDTKYGYYDPLAAFGTAMMLEDWISETDENAIMKKYRTTPGALYSKLTNADWVIYAAIELSKLLHRSPRELVDIRVRLRYGIKDELLDLVRLEQIGRVRARRLYDSGIRSVKEIRVKKDEVVKILGREIAEKVFSQLDM